MPKYRDLYGREKASMPAFRADRLFYNTGSGFAPVGKLYWKNNSAELEQLYGAQPDPGPAMGDFRFYAEVFNTGSAGVFFNHSATDYSTFSPTADSFGIETTAANTGMTITHFTSSQNRITINPFPNNNQIVIDTACMTGPNASYTLDSASDGAFWPNQDDPYPVLKVTRGADEDLGTFNMTFTPSNQRQFWYRTFDGTAEASAWKNDISVGDKLTFDVFLQTQNPGLGGL